MVSLDELAHYAKQKEAENKNFFKHLKRSTPKNLDVVIIKLHDKVFQNLNCLECANCCKSISPVVTDKDIERISKHLKIRPALFTEKFLHLDDEQDYVFNNTPCPFLLHDNYCRIYEARPKACAGYPHTDRKHFIQILDITLKNTFICPAAFEVVEKLKESFAAHR